MQTTLSTSYATDKGRERARNEDAVLVTVLANPGSHQALLAVVADGVGGLSHGHLASHVAVKAFKKEVRATLGLLPQARLSRGFVAAHSAVQELGRKRGARIGTTLLGALVEQGQVFIANVGDSRAYRIDADSVEQVSDDHSVAAEQVRLGKLTESEANQSPYRTALTRCLISGEAPPEVDQFGPLSLDGAFLFCTDGLHAALPDDQIASVVRQLSPVEAAEELIRRANAAGGPDNISLVIVEAERPR